MTAKVLPDTVPTKDEILGMLAQLRSEGMDFWQGMDADRFWSRLNVPWSPADNVNHLILSTQPVARALRIPRLVLRFLFGVSPSPSRTWNALISTYLGSLSGGASAGRYAPKLSTQPNNILEEQKKIVSQFASAVHSLEKAVQQWSEESLDRYRLPHPVLGKLTIREMLMFTLFHYDHHRDHVARRLREQSV
jgi:hypothetical protein